VRHASGDSATLAEVFHRRDYDPPAAVLRALGEPRSILDLGANVGLFGLHAAALWPSAAIVAYEPDPDNAAVHSLAIAANALGTRWTLVEAAAGATDGEVALAAGHAMASHVAGPGDAPEATVPVAMRDVLEQTGAADLVKLDIEGGEWEILLDPRFAKRPPRAIVLEYHPEQCPTDDPRTTATEALRGAGLEVAPIWHGEDGYGMLWGWRAAPAGG
jgi:FkbM family methyltransferase